MPDPINILIVDDEPKNLTVLETVLDDPAYRLVRAESADQALLALVAEEFALLILDIRMPGMTGFELAQMIKERKKTARVPIIFLTAYYNEDQHVLTGYDSGAVDYLHKPVSAPILRSKVAVFAELHRTQRECGLANRTLLAEMTERRRAEEQLRVLNETLEQRVAERTEALRESEERLRRIFKQSPAGIVQTDVHGNMTLVNDRWCEMLGFSRAELLERNVAEVTDASSLELTLENVRRLAEGGPDFQIEKNYRRKDGTMLQVQSNVAGLRDAAGRYQGLLAVVLDLTERDRAEAARRLTNERLTLAVECSQVVLFQQDLELRYTWLQNAVPGFEDSHAIGKRDAEVMERAADAAVTEALKREVIRSGVSHRQEVLVHIQGVGRHYDLLVEPQRDAAGLISGVTCAAIDITERKRAEEGVVRLAAIVESSEDALFSEDLDGIVISWNRGAQETFGYTADEIMGTSILRLIPEAYQAEEHEHQRTLASGARGGHFETRRLTKDGRQFPAAITISPLKDAAGAVIGTSRVVRDITARKRAEEALCDNAAVLADLDRRKDAFLATLSHELRNPLAVIGSSLHLLRFTGQDPAAVQQGCTRMQRQVMLLTRLIDDLMDVSRINQDKLTLHTERLDLATVAQSALENSRSVLDQRGQTVTVVLPPQPIAVDGDATRLAQVVGNLLTNAAKYSDPGSRIGLTVERQGDVAAVAVRDRGIGIAPGDLCRVFELFAQVNGAAHLAQGGLGIGLSLVKRVVELHGGSVEARSDGLGHGSEFLVRLPLASAEARTETPPDHQMLSPSPARHYRILVADDNEDAVTTLALLLTHLGHDVRTADNGAQAVAVAATFQPEVALLDIGMPELDGHEACRRIRAQPGGDTMVLVAVSGWGQDDDKRRARHAGFQHHFVKPVDLAALTALLHSLAPA